MPRRSRHVPDDVTITVDCPVCDCDVSAYVNQGHVSDIECVNGCQSDYSDDQRATVDQAAKDAADTARHDLEFEHRHRCGYDSVDR
jgi:hypothetical protein